MKKTVFQHDDVTSYFRMVFQVLLNIMFILSHIKAISPLIKNLLLLEFFKEWFDEIFEILFKVDSIIIKICLVIMIK